MYTLKLVKGSVIDVMRFENEVYQTVKAASLGPQLPVFKYRILNLVCIVGLTIVFSLTPTTWVRASSDAPWATTLGVYNPACTNGELSCWSEPSNQLDQLEQVRYQSLDADVVQNKHHICVSFPHLKDSYWAGVAYGIISEGKRLNQKITLLEAGGYTNLETQLNQVAIPF